MSKQHNLLFAGLLLYLGAIDAGKAEQVHIAVASNALAAMKAIGAAFETRTGHTVVISSGSTGNLYAQIVNGAPYDVFLAANDLEPQKLEQDKLILPGSRFTYALGKLVAWSSDSSLLAAKDIATALLSPAVTRIAIANPKTAPYGLAARQAMQALGIWDKLQSKIIRGENVSQAYQFAVSNNAQIAFIAESQIRGEADANGSVWEVPQTLYSPIRQQGTVLLRARNNTAAKEFADFLKSDRAREILSAQFGYGIEQEVAVK